MELPKYVDTSRTERIGVNKAALILSQMGLIFRETSNSDIGIDGQIEEVDEYCSATGRVMAVQIKSGKSYLHEKDDGWRFYVDEAHKNYWRLFPIPVMLLVHNTEDGNIYFLDAKYTLNSTGEIVIPKKNILSPQNKGEFLKTLGGCHTKYSEIEDVFNMMQSEIYSDGDFSISFLELFVLGLTNLCSDLFYDVSIATEIAQSKSKEGISIGQVFHDFLWNYILFLVKENLAEINFHACLYDYEVRLIQPRFIAPLTYRGRQLSHYVSSLEQQYLEDSGVPIMCESFVNLNFDHYSVIRLERLTELRVKLEHAVIK